MVGGPPFKEFWKHSEQLQKKGILLLLFVMKCSKL